MSIAEMRLLELICTNVKKMRQELMLFLKILLEGRDGTWHKLWKELIELVLS